MSRDPVPLRDSTARLDRSAESAIIGYIGAVNKGATQIFVKIYTYTNLLQLLKPNHSKADLICPECPFKSRPEEQNKQKSIPEHFPF
jgi:hypothetical protein